MGLDAGGRANAVPIRVVYMSTPAFGVPALTLLANDPRFEVAAVVTQPDKPAGRGLKRTPPPVKRAAERLGLPVLQPASLRTPEALREIACRRPDVIAVAAYGLWIPGEIFNLPPKRSLNLHPSLLPRYRGAAPVVGALLAGETEVGLSVLFVEDEMDAGDILAQMRVPVMPGDTTATLMDRLAYIGAPFFVETLAGWVDGTIVPVPQDHSQASWIDRLRKADGLLDWTLPAEELARRCRAFSPWPGTFTFYRGQRLLIHSAWPLNANVPIPGIKGPPEPGTVLALPQGIGVVTGNGMLMLERVQLAGRRPLDVRRFICGQPSFVGSRLGIEQT